MRTGIDCASSQLVTCDDETRNDTVRRDSVQASDR